ncbi:MAG: DUF5666 domain-containing protein [Caldilineaceae bacterium]
MQAGSSNSAMPTQGYQQPMNDGGERTQDFHSEEGEVEGEILRRPSDSQGAGGWLMRSDRGIWYWIYADQDTEFKPGLPDIGDRVKAKYSWEFYGGHYWAVAKVIEVEHKSGSSSDEKVEGILVSRPDDGLGLWTIQTGLTQTVAINVDANTRLDEVLPTPGDWIEIRGLWQSDNTFDADRVRNDDHELNEVIVRLADGVISATVANRYEVNAVTTLLASGNIHLFSTKEDEEENIVGKLAADPDVIWAELNFTGGIPERHGYKTWHWGGDTPDGYVNQNAFKQVNLDPALTAAQGEGMVIAVLDTGIALDHQEFVGRLLSGYDMVDDDAVPNVDGDGLGWGAWNTHCRHHCKNEPPK